MNGSLKILLVSDAFQPEISPRSFRATELALEFSRLGHSVSVITRNREFDYSAFGDMHGMKVTTWGKAILPVIRTTGKGLFSLFGRIISRLLLVLLEYPSIESMFRVKRSLKGLGGFDLMISFAVPFPVHWGVAWARTRSNRIAGTWIADCGDPYMGDTLDSFRKPFYFSYLEKAFCRKADYITIPVESAKPAYYHEFHDKIRIIPQGFRFDLPVPSVAKDRNPFPEFAYAGRFLKGIRDPKQMLEYLVRTSRPFRFHVYTDQPELLNDFTTLLEGRLIIYPYISRPELMEKLSGMDFLINFDNNTGLNIPSKLIDYAIAGRPVLNIEKCFNPDLMDRFLEGDYTGSMSLPEPEQYHIRNVAGKFLGLVSMPPK